MNEMTIKIILIALGLGYFLYLYFFDCRQVNDERREMIRLKSLRLTQKTSLAVLVIITFTNCFVKNIPNIYILGTLLIIHIILEVGLKIYFEQRL